MSDDHNMDYNVRKDPERQHNLLGNSVAAQQLSAYVSRIERIKGEISDLNEDIAEVYGEAKSMGFDKKILRKVVQRHMKGKDTVVEEDALVMAYEEAIQAAKDNMIRATRDPLE